jgi:integrase
VESWTASELRGFIDHVRDDRLFALRRLPATTGMRRGELLGLSHLNLDLACGRLRVERQLLASGEFGPPKSGRGERTIALDAETVEALRHHVDTQQLERIAAGPAYQDADLVFADEIGRPIPPRRLTEYFVSRRKAAGVRVGTLHVFRHTAATLALTAIGPCLACSRRAARGRPQDHARDVRPPAVSHSDAMAADAIAAQLAPAADLVPDRSR